MKRYVSKDFRTFLRAVDRRLKKPFRLVVIGGAAAALTLDPRKATVDIDTANKVDAIREACQAARSETGLQIPLAFATAYEAPLHFLKRLKLVGLAGLRNLEILVPEKHDWALLKMARCTRKDLDDVLAVHRIRRLNKNVLLKRFRTEMVGRGSPRERLLLHFLTLAEELWGVAEADRMAQVLRPPSSPGRS